MVIVDASVWIDFLRGTATPEAEWLDRQLGARPLGLTDLTLCEVLQGVSEQQAAEVRDRLLQLQVLSTGGTGLALAAADNYRRLRHRGFTIRKTIDCWIATFCLRQDHTLLHRDRDFDPFERFLGLRVVHP
ncbi:MAG: PIN domain nuclease [bacterium]|nr:PIN domain nuclease [bacterium]